LKEIVIKLAQSLVRASTEAGKDNGAQKIIIEFLSVLGFNQKTIVVGGQPNLCAVRGQNKPLLAFSGHTDVVPPGKGWSREPFAAEILEDRLFGRGVADMKGSIAAFLVALESFLKLYPEPNFDIALLIAGDEETSCKGTPALLEYLSQLGRNISWCIVGEPSSTQKLADSIRVGRRGSLSCKLKVIGVQGHVAYPQLDSNPNHLACRIVYDLINEDFDKEIPITLDTQLAENDEGWPATSLQITHFASGLAGSTNVIPAQAEFAFNVRFRLPHSRDSLISTIEQIISRTTKSFEVVWSDGSVPFNSELDFLRKVAVTVIEKKFGYLTRFSRDGGTSDGRFISAAGAEVMELGPSNETIHQVDENLKVDELYALSDLYLDILTEFNSHA